MEPRVLPSLDLHITLQISGYLLGTVLHALLLGLFIRRRRRRPGEALFALLVCAVGLWNLGQFLEAFFKILLKSQLPPYALVTFDLIAYAGLLILPSALLHSLLALLLARGGLPRLADRRWLLVLGALLIYAPLASFPRIIALTLQQPGAPGFTQLAELTPLYFAWFILAFLTSAALSFVLARRARDKRERTFYLSLIATAIGSSLLLSFIFTLRYESIDKVGITLESIIIMVSTFPSAMFGYYVFRYDDVEFFLRRSLFYLVLLGATVIAYLWGIQVFAAFAEQRWRLDAKLVEAVSIIALIFLFRPFQTLLLRFFDRIFFRETFVYQRVLTELVEYIGRGTALRVRALIEHVARTIGSALGAERSEIILIAPSGAASFSNDRERDPPRIEACRRLLDERPWSYFRIADLGAEALDLQALEELVALDAEAVVPVRHERRIIALIVVGSKRDRRPLFAEEIELLLALAGHLGMALEGLKLYEDNRRLERLLDQTERRLALGRFSASVAHRVKNPLSSIKAITQSMALDMTEADERRADLMLVVSEIDRLNAIVDQLLGYAQVEARADREPLAVEELALEVAELFQHEAALYEVATECPPPDETIYVRAERAGLREVLSNLIQNAIHASEPGGRLTVRIDRAPRLPDSIAPRDRPPTPPEGWCLIAVLDEGPGIPEDQRTQIFEPFFTTKAQGTGLGLAISQRKARELDGLIVAAPRGDQRPGAALHIYLPAAPPPEARTIKSEAAAAR